MRVLFNMFTKYTLNLGLEPKLKISGIGTGTSPEHLFDFLKNLKQTGNGIWQK